MKGPLYELMRQRAEAPRDERGLVRMHASALTTDDPRKKFCGRAYALAHVLERDGVVQTVIPFHLSVTFAIGYMVQDYVTDALTERLVGDWVCRSCGHRVERVKFPKNCELCGHESLKYEETRIVSKTTGISCGIDAVVDLDTDRIIVEVKSLDKDKFKELKKPLWEHVQRTSLYLRVLEDSVWVKGRPNVSKATIVYITKGGFGEKIGDEFRPVKEFEVIRDDSITDSLWIAAGEVSDFIAGEGPMPARVCADPCDVRTTTCPFVVQCFAKG